MDNRDELLQAAGAKAAKIGRRKRSGAPEPSNIERLRAAAVDGLISDLAALRASADAEDAPREFLLKLAQLEARLADATGAFDGGEQGTKVEIDASLGGIFD